MTVKAVNNTAELDDLVPTILIFRAYSSIYSIDPPVLTIIKKTVDIETAMDKIRKIRAENQVADVLNTRNESLVDFIHNLSFNSDVLV